MADVIFINRSTVKWNDTYDSYMINSVVGGDTEAGASLTLGSSEVLSATNNVVSNAVGLISAGVSELLASSNSITSSTDAVMTLGVVEVLTASTDSVSTLSGFITMGIAEDLAGTVSYVSTTTQVLSLGVVEVVSSSITTTSVTAGPLLTLGTSELMTGTSSIVSVAGALMDLGVTELLASTSINASTADAWLQLGIPEPMTATATCVVAETTKVLAMGVSESLSHNIGDDDINTPGDTGNLFIDGEDVLEDENGNINFGTTGSGNLSITTDTFKYGSSSVRVSGDASNKTWASYLVSIYTEADYTIDFWYNSDYHSVGTVAGVWLESHNNYKAWKITKDNYTTLTFHYMTSDYVVHTLQITNTFVEEEWTHITATRSGGVVRVFVNGVQTNSVSEPLGMRYFTGRALFIGYTQSDSTYYNFIDGYVDQFRMVRGDGLWTSDFDVDSLNEMFYDIYIPETYAVSNTESLLTIGVTEILATTDPIVSTVSAAVLTLGIGEVLAAGAGVNSNTSAAVLTLGITEILTATASTTAPVSDSGLTLGIQEATASTGAIVSTVLNSVLTLGVATPISSTINLESIVSSFLNLGITEVLEATTSPVITVANSPLLLGEQELLAATRASVSTTIAELTLGIVEPLSATATIPSTSESVMILGIQELLSTTDGATSNVTAGITLGEAEALSSTTAIISNASAVTIVFGVTESLSATDNVVSTTTSLITLGVTELLASTVANASTTDSTILIGGSEILTSTAGSQPTSNVTDSNLILGIGETLTSTGGISTSSALAALLLGEGEILTATTNVVSTTASFLNLGTSEYMSSTCGVVSTVSAALILGTTEDLSASIGPIVTTSNSLLDLGVTEILADVDNALVTTVTGALTLGGGIESLAHTVSKLAVGQLFIDAEDNVIEDKAGVHTITNSGVTIDDNIKKYGSSSLYFNGMDSLTIPDHSSLNFGSNDFTIDTWYRFESFVSSASLASKWAAIDRSYSWDVTAGVNEIRLYHSIDGSEELISVDWTPSLDTWYHFAIVREGNDVKFYVDGVQIGSTQTIVGALRDSSEPFVMLAGGGEAGWMDNFRLTNGEARWTSNFDINDIEVMKYKEDYITSESDGLVDLGITEILGVSHSAVSYAVASLGFGVTEVLSSTIDLTTSGDADATLGITEELSDECVSWTSITGLLTTGISEIMTVTSVSNSVADAVLTMGVSEPIAHSITTIPGQSLETGDLFIDGESVIQDENAVHTITNYGVGINSSIKKYGNSSLNFDSDYLTAPDHIDFNFGSGSFTIDFWVRFIDLNGVQVVICQWENSGGSDRAWQISYYDGAFRFLARRTDGTYIIDISSNATISIDTWYHIACVRDGSTAKMYIDGIAQTETNTTSDAISNATVPLMIGDDWNDGATGPNGDYFSGYLDNIRLDKGAALWTSDFDSSSDEELHYETPATPEPYAISTTSSSLILGIDTPLTATTGPIVTAQASLLSTGVAEILASTTLSVSVTAAALILGITEVLTSTIGAVSNISSILTFGVDEPLSATSSPTMLAVAALGFGVSEYMGTANASESTAVASLTLGVSEPLSATSSTTQSAEANLGFGIVEAASVSTTFTSLSVAELTLGVSEPLSATSSPTMSVDAGITMGIDTPMSASYTVQSSVTGAILFGVSELLASTSVSAATSDASLTIGVEEYMTATGLVVSNTVAFISFGVVESLSATQEFVSTNNAVPTLGVVEVLASTSSVAQSSTTAVFGTGGMEMVTGSTGATSYSVALMDLGVSEVLGSTDAIVSVCGPSTLSFGVAEDLSFTCTTNVVGSPGDLFIDGEEIVEDETGTHTITNHGNISIDLSESAQGNSSVAFDGDGDYLTIPNSEDFNFGSGDFTIDTWVRFNTLSGVQVIISQDEYLNNPGHSWFLQKRSDNYIRFGGLDSSYNYTIDLYSTDAVLIDTWYHIAVVRNGSSCKLYINGIENDSVVPGGAILTPIRPLMIGDIWNNGATGPAGYHLDGNVDNVRITKGIALWTSAFDTDTDLDYPGKTINTYVADSDITPVLTMGVSESLSSTINFSTESDGSIATGIVEVLATLGFGITVATASITMGVDEPLAHTIGDDPIPGEVLTYTIDQCEGGIVTSTAAATWGDDWRVFDNSVSTHWAQETGGTNWIQYKFASSKQIQKIRILSFYQGGYEPIKDYTLYGSNTGAFGGEEISLVTGQNPEGDMDGIYEASNWHDEEFSNANSYIYYRLVVTSNWPGNGGNERHILEMEMMEGATFSAETPEQLVYSNVVGDLGIPGAAEECSSSISIVSVATASSLDTGITELMSAFKMIWSQIHTPPLTLGITELVSSTTNVTTLVGTSDLIKGIAEVMSSTTVSNSVADASLTLGIGEYLEHTIDIIPAQAAGWTEDLCEGGAATANGWWSSWGPASAFDNNVSTGWHYATTFPAWLQYQFTESKTIRKYTIRNRYGTDNQAPRNWTFEGSNNGNDWTTLDTQLNVTWTSYEKEFLVDNDISYEYYRLYVTAAWGALSIMEVEMLEEIPEVLEHYEDYAATTATALLSTGDDELMSSTVISTGVVAGELIFGLIEVMSATNITTSFTIGQMFMGLEEIQEGTVTCSTNVTAVMGRTPMMFRYSREHSSKGGLFKTT